MTGEVMVVWAGRDVAYVFWVKGCMMGERLNCVTSL